MIDIEWQTREDFEKLNKEGSVWIVHKGSVELAFYHLRRKRYYFNEFYTGYCFLAECITSVQPIIKPNPPEGTLWK